MADDKAISFLDCFAFATLGLAMTRLVEVLLELNCYDLFSITRTAENVDLIAVDIGKSLNSDEDSPLKSMIKLTDARKKDKETLSLSAIVGALKKILKNKDIAFSNLDLQQQLLVLKNYFKCIKTMFPDAWGLVEDIY
ncbi:MAG: hypothetical protein COW10_06375 [Candidatus Omnitrophica bacterium CG12_big_fil_rev_8_21_14_0_65_42_8]|nr:MAG: hypothetical protein COW10_06375 [Candidatus Omnitrophica bacterium CG12_big_fil_rev_8_21_14_0_65_42_8]